jgi:glycosyltransferase involved in cell wall biosynthesis
LLVINPDAGWVRAPFMAMPPGVDVYFLHILNIRERARWRHVRWADVGRWRRISSNVYEIHFFLPTYFRRVTQLFARLFTRVAFGAAGPTAVYFTYPTHVSLIDCFRRALRVYLAHDPFAYYGGWDPQTIARQESELLERCDFVMAVSQMLVEDFKSDPTRRARVEHVPNGVERAAIADILLPRPKDLPHGRPIVGCIGQINNTFDWEFIAELTASVCDFVFVFIGPLIEDDPGIAASICGILQRPNVLWLGSRPHADRMAYISHFEVCLCPLRVNAQNDRRCPLRIFDYLASGRPVITTNVREAVEHSSHVMVARSAAEAAALLEEIRSGSRQTDASGMKRYALDQTWEVRARQMIDILGISPAVPDRAVVSTCGS